jgi:hypothetical protein
MPKKKLTKAQVKKAIKNIHANLRVLFDDKVYSERSLVPMTAQKLLDIGTKFSMARDRMK